jgi:very-short-patch-repair endonuclease
LERDITNSRKLRKNMTEAETLLWSKIRGDQLGFRFRRQHSLTPYIADFYCYESRLIIEVDGGQHNDNQLDVVRDKFFETQGIQVLRFWNNEVLENIEGVVQKIALSLNPSPEGRGRLKI